MAFYNGTQSGLLIRVPTSLFAIALGLTGLGATMRVAAEHTGMRPLMDMGTSFLFIAAVALTLDVLVYLMKIVRHRSEVAADLSMATRANLLAPGFMAATALGGVFGEGNSIGGMIWVFASLGHLILLLGFVGQWLTRDYAPEELNPTWFMPAAGIMTAPMYWPHYGPIEYPLFLLGIGVTLWIMLLPLVFRRLVFEPPVTPTLRPTLFIIGAPFGLLAGSLMNISAATPDILPILLLSGGAFFFLVLLSKAAFLLEAGATLGWWATTFPISTVSAGFIRASEDGSDAMLWVGLGLLALACATTTFAAIATAMVGRSAILE